MDIPPKGGFPGLSCLNDLLTICFAANCDGDCMMRTVYTGSFNLIKKYLKSRRVLDLGCNTGYHLTEAEEGSLGLDYNEEYCKTAKNYFKNIYFCRTNLNDPYFPILDKKFEVIIASHVLEHIHAPIYFLRECNRALVKGGTLVIGLPIEDGIYARHFLDYFGQAGHIYSFSEKNIQKLLLLTGFTEFKNYYNLARLGYHTWFNNKANEFLNKWVPNTLLYHFSSAYWVVSTKILDYEDVVSTVSGIIN